MTTKTAKRRKSSMVLSHSSRTYIYSMSSPWMDTLPAQEKSIVRDFVPLIERLSTVSGEFHALELLARTVESFPTARSKTDNKTSFALAELRGKLAREELKQQEGGHVSASEAADTLGISKPALLKRYNLGQIVGWREAKQDAVRLPVWQFKGDHLLPGLLDALKVLNTAPWMDDWGRVLFYLTPVSAMAGKRPLDLLRSGKSQEVINLAKAAIE